MAVLQRVMLNTIEVIKFNQASTTTIFIIKTMFQNRCLPFSFVVNLEYHLRVSPAISDKLQHKYRVGAKYCDFIVFAAEKCAKWDTNFTFKF